MASALKTRRNTGVAVGRKVEARGTFLVQTGKSAAVTRKRSDFSKVWQVSERAGELARILLREQN